MDDMTIVIHSNTFSTVQSFNAARILLIPITIHKKLSISPECFFYKSSYRCNTIDNTVITLNTALIAIISKSLVNNPNRLMPVDSLHLNSNNLER